MKHKSTHRPSAIRFSRFSNKGYAVFRSLHREVTIGRLKIDLCDSALLKSGDSKALVPYRSENYGDAAADDPDISEREAALTGLAIALFLSLKTTTLNAAAAAAALLSSIKGPINRPAPKGCRAIFFVSMPNNTS